MNKLQEGEIIPFDMFFASIVSMAVCHPGNTKLPSEQKMTLNDCAKVAMEMLKVRRELLPDE